METTLMLDALEEGIQLLAEELRTERNKIRVLLEVNKQLSEKLTELMEEKEKNGL